MKVFLKCLLVILFCNISLFSFSQNLEKLWETDSVFKVPESVFHDGKSNLLYITNIDGKEPWGKDGKGSVGKMSADGKNIVVEWVTGLDAPKGLGLYKGMLYVADLSDVVVIDVKKASIVNRIHIQDASGLNDLSIDDNGVVYVSDMLEKKVYRIENGKAETLLSNLQNPNGVLVKGNNFYLLDGEAFFKMEKDRSLTKIAEGMDGGIDGIEQIKDNEFIISCWLGVIWYIHADGSKTLMLDTRSDNKNTADIGYDPKTKTVFVPTFWRNTVIAYKIK
jgi:hypothetical protein